MILIYYLFSLYQLLMTNNQSISRSTTLRSNFTTFNFANYTKFAFVFLSIKNLL